MAFCTSCGAQLDANAQFCVKCGTRQAAGVGAGAAAAPAPSQSSGGGALKIVLIVIGAVILLGIVGSIVSMVFIGKKVHDAKIAIAERGGDTTVVTPMGTVRTTKDPAQIAENLGVDVYPGAKAIEGGSDAQVMGMHTITGLFETDDPVEKVGEFYHQRYPKGMYTASDHEVSLVSGNKGAMITITVNEEGGRTKITVVNMTGKGVQAPNASGEPN